MARRACPAVRLAARRLGLGVTLREDIKKGKIKPMPADCLVTGRFFTYEGPVERCIGHVFVTRKAKKNKFFQSGYEQAALCVNCGEEVVPRCASWWMDAASPKYIQRAAKMAREERKRLVEVVAYLEEALEC